MGPLVIVSGPSGGGKSTVIGRLLKECPVPLRLSVSATTRPRRVGERDGVHYYFWTHERFEAERRAGGFLEWAEVHGNYYGTLRSEVEPHRNAGIGVILDIDVQGASQVAAQYPDHVSVFLRAPSVAAYEARLRKRGTEDEPAIRKRLAAIQRELAGAGSFQHQLTNDDLNAVVAELCSIVRRKFEGDQNAR